MENGVFGVNMVNVQEDVEVELKRGKENVIIPLQKMVEKNVMVPVQKTRIVKITKKIVQVCLKCLSIISTFISNEMIFISLKTNRPYTYGVHWDIH